MEFKLYPNPTLWQRVKALFSCAHTISFNKVTVTYKEYKGDIFVLKRSPSTYAIREMMEVYGISSPMS